MTNQTQAHKELDTSQNGHESKSTFLSECIIINLEPQLLDPSQVYTLTKNSPEP